MPNLTGRWPVWYPIPGSPLIPFENNFLTLAQSVADMLDGYDLPLSVASAGARDTLFPSPTQGDRVYRRDLATEQTYLAAYNAGTNPGGANPAGWYSDKVAIGLMRAATVATGAAALVTFDTLVDAKGFSSSVPTSSIVIPVAGLYSVSFSANVDQTAGNFFNSWIRKNGADLSLSTGHPYPHSNTNSRVYWDSFPVKCVPGDTIAIAISSSTTGTLTANNTYMMIEQVG